jgi:hypothetical protein
MLPEDIAMRRFSPRFLSHMSLLTESSLPIVAGEHWSISTFS